MEFRFSYKVKPENLWVLSMINIYRSILGMVNIIFTISMVMLAIRFWSEITLNMKIPMTAGLLLFPIIQPLFLFLRSRKLVSSMPDNLEMSINNKGLMLVSHESRSHVEYSDLKSVIRIRGMLILYTKSKQGFILNRQTLDGNGQELFGFLSKKVSK